ncbi:MAG: hypothetical protein HN470_03610 [Nitrosomonadales bacterium]|jgi:hypothetical protein|nr:hypothetical protein [Nitrosomonadales bacterium]
MRKLRIILILLFVCLPASAENFFEYGKLIAPTDLEALVILDGSSEHAEKLLRNLQRYESYRPTSYSDATRNPFNKNKRYQFFDDKLSN